MAGDPGITPQQGREWCVSQDIQVAIAAARSGDLQRMQQLLTDRLDPNAYDTAGWTPLLAAAVRGRTEIVAALVANANRPARVDMPHRASGGLPIHYAGQSGVVGVADLLLQEQPDHLDAVWELNGHTLLLQAVFYGHVNLTQYALGKGANTAATTVRGLGAMELAKQFQNQSLIDLIAPKDKSGAEKAAYYQGLLSQIAPLRDQLATAIQDGLTKAAQDANAAAQTFRRITSLVRDKGADVNELGGSLQQPALVVAVTGGDGFPANPAVASLRADIVQFLLECGASPTVREVHPMGVHAIIRAAVFNHLAILQLMARYVSERDFTSALNEQPVVNGLTALHDSVLRASTAGPDKIDGYLEQIRWLVEKGARSDIEDFSGRTQRAIAESVSDVDRRTRLLQALGEHRS
jgi:ankyrin repeat protein